MAFEIKYASVFFFFPPAQPLPRFRSASSADEAQQRPSLCCNVIWPCAASPPCRIQVHYRRPAVQWLTFTTPALPVCPSGGRAVLSCSDKTALASAEVVHGSVNNVFGFVCFFYWYLCAHRVIQSVDVQDHRFGPLVVGAQEEVSLALAGRRCSLGLLRLLVSCRLEDLVDLGGEQFRLSG